MVSMRITHFLILDRSIVENHLIAKVTKNIRSHHISAQTVVSKSCGSMNSRTEMERARGLSLRQHSYSQSIRSNNYRKKCPLILPVSSARLTKHCRFLLKRVQH